MYLPCSVILSVVASLAITKKSKETVLKLPMPMNCLTLLSLELIPL